MTSRPPIRLALVWSADVGIPWSMPFCEPLLERGWDITFICPRGPNAALAEQRGMTVLPLSLQRKIHPVSDLLGAVQLLRYFVSDRYDIVHTHNIKAGLLGRVVAGATRVPIVLHTHTGMVYASDDPPMRRRAFATLERIASLFVDAVLVETEEDGRTVIETGTIDEAKVSAIGGGIDLSGFDPEAFSAEHRRTVRAEIGAAEDAVVFLSAGRLIREKGFVELFEATAEARRTDPRITLAVAGEVDFERSDGLDPETLERATRSGTLLLGRRDDMMRLYGAADVVALASWHEGLSRVLMEGMAMAKPLLVTDARGNREIVRPPSNGIVVPMRSAADLTRAMLELAADAGRRETLGRANAVEARHKYDIRRLVERIIGEYDRLLASKGLA